MSKKKECGFGRAHTVITPSIYQKMNINSTESNQKARYWVGILYPENMIDNWQDKICQLVQRPHSYCIHNADTDSEKHHRKDHVHLILVWGNPTTYKAAMRCFKTLEKPGCVAVNKIEVVHNIRYMYNYLIHDTDDARKQGKHQYDPSERICGCGFDIGNYEQLSVSDKTEILNKIKDMIDDRVILNYYDLLDAVTEAVQDGELTTDAYDVVRSYQSFLYHMVSGYYSKIKSMESGEYVKLKAYAYKMKHPEEEEGK